MHADFPDRCYAVQAAPFAFGTDSGPTAIITTGNADGVGAAVAQFNTGSAMLTFPSYKSEFAEVIELVGSKGRMTLDQWGHCPTRLTVRKSPAVCWEEPQGHTSTSQNGIPAETEQFIYPVPEPAGYPAKGWNYSNQHGFIYQARAVHRCLVARLKQCPQYTESDSMMVMHMLDEIDRQMKSGGVPSTLPKPIMQMIEPRKQGHHKGFILLLIIVLLVIWYLLYAPLRTNR